MAVRDRVAVAVIAAGVLLGMAAWQAWGPWQAVVVAVVALVVAAQIYRVEGRAGRRRHGSDGPLGDGEARSGVSTPRRAAGRP